jgi:hypothetical protein
MKIRLLFPIFLALIFSSCTSPVPKPNPFLNQKQMVKLLTEVHLTEAMLQQLQSTSYTLDSTNLYTNAMYAELFKKYDLNKESFEANLYYRAYHSRDLEKILKKVYDNLHRLDSLSQQPELVPLEKMSGNRI